MVKAERECQVVCACGGSRQPVPFASARFRVTSLARRPVGCYGPEASAFTKHLVTGRRVTLRYDRELHDRYGRFLAYVWLAG